MNNWLFLLIARRLETFCVELPTCYDLRYHMLGKPNGPLAWKLSLHLAYKNEQDLNTAETLSGKSDRLSSFRVPLSVYVASGSAGDGMNPCVALLQDLALSEDSMMLIAFSCIHLSWKS